MANMILEYLHDFMSYYFSEELTFTLLNIILPVLPIMIGVDLVIRLKNKKARVIAVICAFVCEILALIPSMWRLSVFNDGFGMAMMIVIFLPWFSSWSPIFSMLYFIYSTVRNIIMKVDWKRKIKKYLLIQVIITVVSIPLGYLLSL